MSNITNLILSFCGSENHNEVDVFLNNYANKGREFKLVSIDNPALQNGWHGGTKHMESTIYIGAYNNFDHIDFLTYLKKFPWKYPEEVQLLIKCQYDDIFSSYLINE